jgi:hypothetical protein
MERQQYSVDADYLAERRAHLVASARNAAEAGDVEEAMEYAQELTAMDALHGALSKDATQDWPKENPASASEPTVEGPNPISAFPHAAPAAPVTPSTRPSQGTFTPSAEPGPDSSAGRAPNQASREPAFNPAGEPSRNAWPESDNRPAPGTGREEFTSVPDNVAREGSEDSRPASTYQTNTDSNVSTG